MEEDEMTMTKQYPDHTLEKALRVAGASVKVLWEEKGPRNTSIEWQVCYSVNGSLCLVQTFQDGGWDALTPCGSVDIIETIADVLNRCGVPVPA